MRRSSSRLLPVAGVLCAALAVLTPTAASAAGSPAAGDVSVGTAGTVQLVAGGGSDLAADDVPATAVRLQGAYGLAHDAAGNLFFAEFTQDRVRRVDARTEVISTVRGVRTPGSAPESGPRLPWAVAVSPAGDVYVAGVEEVVEFTHDGRLVPITGPGSPLESLKLRVVGLALDATGSLYLSDVSSAPRILKRSPAGAVTVVAGGHDTSHAGDGGPALAASLTEPTSLRVAADGALLFVDSDRVRRVGPDGTIRIVAGGGSAICDGAPATDSNLNWGLGIALDGAGRLLITESGADRVQRLESDGTLRTILGQGYDRRGTPPATLGAPAATNNVSSPGAPDVLPDGRLVLAEYGQRLLAVVPGETPGVERTYAGDGNQGVAGNNGDGGPACRAHLAYPTSVARAADGSTYVVDYLNSQIRRITPDGRISTVAGTGLPGFSGDGGPGTAAQLDRPRAVAVDPAGRVLIADVVNNRIRRLDPATGLITTIAGTGQWGNSGDGGSATSAQLAGPHGVTASPDGTVWVADTGNHTIRRISPDGTISTAAGTGTHGTPGGTGDGGPATSAQLTSPRAVAADGTALYLSDPGTRSVRRIDLATGTISTLAGPATGTPLTNPASLLPTPAGLLVADAGSNRILRISPTGTVAVVAGTGKAGWRLSWSTRRAADQVPLAQPQGLALEADGTLLVTDTGSHQLLRISQP